jgi:hypothetical protein
VIGKVRHTSIKDHFVVLPGANELVVFVTAAASSQHHKRSEAAQEYRDGLSQAYERDRATLPNRFSNLFVQWIHSPFFIELNRGEEPTCKHGAPRQIFQNLSPLILQEAGQEMLWLVGETATPSVKWVK